MSKLATSSSDVSDAPSDALMELLAPDGYYTYLGVPKNSVATTEKKDDSAEERASLTAGGAPVSSVDEDLVKKNYRKLSLKHHPDRPRGDVETFRVLNRAHRVLMDPKLRKQYDILGIDLDDDDEEHPDKTENEEGEAPSTAQGIVQEIAGMALATIIQVAVRTGTWKELKRKTRLVQQLRTVPYSIITHVF